MWKENHRRARMMSSNSAMASNVCQASQKYWKVTKNITFNRIHHILNMWLLLESNKEKNNRWTKISLNISLFVNLSINPFLHEFIHFTSFFYSLFIHLFKMFLNFEYNIQGGESEDDLYLPVHEIVWLKSFPLGHVTITTSTEYQKRNFPSWKIFRKIMI